MIIKKPFRKNFLVPPVEKVAREMTSTSQVMIIIKLALKLSIFQLIRLGTNNIKYLPGLAKKDFAIGIKLLCELSILPNREIRHRILHSQMTDMAVALNNKKVLLEFFNLSRIYRFEPGLMSNNVPELILLLANMSEVPEDLIIYSSSDRLSSSVHKYIEKCSFKFVVLGSK